MKREMYYLYIDDSGSRLPDKKQKKVRDDKMDHFALGGVLVKESDRDEVINKYKEFYSKWDELGKYPLHSSEIRSKKDNFKWLEESTKKNERFLKSLEDLLISLPVIGIAAVIDRPGYNDRYKERYGDARWWMCETAYPILVERAVKFVKQKNGLLKVRFEHMGKREEKRIERYAKELSMSGHPFNPDTSEKYQPITNEEYKDILHGKPKRRPKANLFIQLADLFLYPIAKHGYIVGDYRPWDVLYRNGKIINAYLPPNDTDRLGIKYSCFDRFG